MQNNPLIGHHGLPLFEKIFPEHIEPAVAVLQKKVDDLLKHFETFTEKVTWETVMGPMAQLDQDFQQGFSPVGHLLGVKNSPELRAAYEKVQPQIVQMGLELDQNKKIFSLLTELNQQNLNSVQKRIVEAKLRDARNSGVALEGEKKKRFSEISQRLSQLSTNFNNHVLDATKAFELIITDKKDMAGLPQSFLDQSAQAYAQHKGLKASPDAEKGPWRLSLDFPSYGPFMKYAENRELREKLYRTRLTLASSGEFDNTGITREILQLRSEKAKLLGFKTYADLSVSSKMAPGVPEIYKFLKDIRSAAKKPSENEMAELTQYAKSKGILKDELKHWDFAYVSEKYREEKFKINEEEVKQYFQFPKVVQGLFQITKKAFGVDVRESQADVQKWHPDVRFYEVWDEKTKKQIAAFFLDPYSRPENKRGGAWMNECISRRMTKDGLEIPVAYLICNGTPPVGNKPSMMPFSEVTTLFHEFGHGLQHMLTTVEFPEAAGIHGVEWDAVELPSQFMENWCYHKETLMGMTSHIDTGAQLPEEIFNKLVAEKNYLEAYSTLRQVLFALTDMDLHHSYDPFGDETIFDVFQNVAKETSVMAPLKEDRFLCAFGHIFAGGYAAGYYSYKWAEVLSADAFAAFEERGLEDKKSVNEQGLKFRNTVLAMGGSKHPLDVFKEFRGREPQIDALLRHSGLAST